MTFGQLLHPGRQRRRLGIAGLLATLALTSGCAAASPPGAASPMDAAPAQDVMAGAVAEAEAPMAAAMPTPAGASLQTGIASAGPRPAPAQAARSSASAKEPSQGDDKLVGDALLIFTGTLSMQVEPKGYSNTIDEVVDTAAELGGYVAQQSDQSVTVRVPSKSFRKAMRAIEKLGEVTNRGVQAQDVSEEYNDLEVRLKSLRATRDRLEEFLARAKNIQEVLQVEEQLSRLNGEIDRIEGRMRFLAKRAAFSTITVTLQPKPTKVVIAEDKHEPTPSKPQTLRLPIDWLESVGLNQLLDL